MTSKTKALKKGKHTPESIYSAPAKKAENTVTTKNHYARNERKDFAARSRERRKKSMLKIGMTEDQILEIFKNEDVRMVLCLYYGSFTIEDEDKKILRGRHAVEKFLKDKKIEAAKLGPTYCWIKTDKEHVDNITETMKPVGRISVTKSEPVTAEKLKEQKNAERKTKKKPTNNTAEVKKNHRQSTKVQKTRTSKEMRAYYAALRKGGIAERIVKHNPTLANKIKKWLEEKKAAEASRVKGNEEERAKHRQLTSKEMKTRKRDRKEAKHKAAQERRRAAEKKRAENNAKLKAERAQKAQKHAQTELKMAA